MLLNRVLLSITCCLFSTGLIADTFTVTSGAPSGSGTLRDLIEQANNNPGADVIEIPESLGEIFPGLGLPALAVDATGRFVGASFEITEDLTIRGLGAKRTVINDHQYWISTAGGTEGFPCDYGTIVVSESDLLIKAHNTGAPINITLENLTLTNSGGLIDGTNINLTLNNFELRNNTPHETGHCNFSMIGLGEDSSLTVRDSYFFNNSGPISTGYTYLVSGDVLIENSEFYGNNVEGLSDAFMFYFWGSDSQTANVEIKDSLFHSLTNSPMYFLKTETHISNSIFDGPLASERSGVVADQTTLTLTNVSMVFPSRSREPDWAYDLPATHLSMFDSELIMKNTALIRPFNGPSDFPVKSLVRTTFTQATNNYEADPQQPDLGMLPSYVCHETLAKCLTPPLGSPLIDGGDSGSALYRDNSHIIQDVLGTNRLTDNAIDIGAIERAQTHAYLDSYHVDQGSTLTVSAPGVMTNDNLDVSDQARVTLKYPPVNGHLTLMADGSLTYVPNAGFHGVDTFVYTLGLNKSNVTGVVIYVKHVGQSPMAQADHYNIKVGATANQLAPGVLSNDSDPDNVGLNVAPHAGLTAMLSRDARYGNLTLNSE